MHNHLWIRVTWCSVVIEAALVGIGCSGGSSGSGESPDASQSTVPPSGDAEDASAAADGGVGPVGEAGTCANPTVPVVFSPMYSAFIPGGAPQTFQIPAVLSDGNMATWSLSDPAQGKLVPATFDMNGVSVPGVMITIEGTGDSMGQVSVTGIEGNGACGVSVLSVTKNTEDDWNIGNARYNDGVALHVGPPAMFDGGGMRLRLDGGFEGGLRGFEGGVPMRPDGGSYFETDGGTACTNCHGATATSGPFTDVAHTPEQTGGFSDTDLQNIILNGNVPDGGYFDPSVINPACDGGAACTAQAYQVWHSFHQWNDIASDQIPGVICYLRSLTPSSQGGTSNFGGPRGRRDGGPGGGRPPGGPSADSGGD